MRKTKWIAAVVSAVMILPAIVPWVQTAHAAAINVSVTVDPTAQRANISPYIYGTNQDFPNTADFTARRLGGNRLTGYNWENNASNAGSDWQHSSDDYLCSGSGCTTPGATLTNFHDISAANGSYSLVTLQMAGYVAADKNGAVSESETAPSSRWRKVVNAKGSPFSLTPDTSDDNVYMDEEVNFLVQEYGSAATPTGIRGYSLDNEPALWSSTHPRIHPAKVGAQELVDKSVALSKAVKAVDPAAEIFGPALYGFYAYYGLQDAPDWPTVKGNYDWYIDYYLDQMKQASATAGKRLLDTLDVHWYPEAEGGGQRIVFGGTGSVDTQKARVQAPRSLWDPTYLENSWIASSFSNFLPILPRLKSSIDTYYPSTKLAITEYSYGGEGDISGGIAQADALGIFGKHGLHFASFWKLESNSDYVNSAFKLYRNYDGNGSKFGDIHVKADTSDVDNSSVYASVMDETNSELHLIVLNKSFDSPLNAEIQIAGSTSYTSGAVYGFDGTSTALNQAGTISSISGNQFTYSVPPLTAYHIVLNAGNPTPPPVPTGLTATAGNQQIALSWNASSGVASYNVKRAAVSGGPYTAIATGVTATSYTDTGLTNGTTYYYVVNAVNGIGESASSPEASAVPIPPPLPGSITLTATAGNTQAVLSWTASTNAASYSVQRATSSSGPFTPVATGLTTTGYTNSGLTNGTTYYFKVTAVNTTGTTDSNTVNATPQLPSTLKVEYRVGDSSATDSQMKPQLRIVNTGASAVPLNQLKIRYWYTKGSSQSEQYNCDWAGVGCANLTSSFATMSTPATGADTYVEIGFTTGAGSVVAGGNSGEIQSRINLANWTNYNEADDYSYNSSQTSFAQSSNVTLYQNGTLIWGNEPGGTTQQPPAAPTGLTATAGNAQAALNWTASSGATGYNVKRATTTGGPYTTVATGVTTTSFTNTDLTNGTTYHYVVSAVNAAGESANSSQASVTPAAPQLPAVPTGLTATAGNAQVALNWTASSGAVSYNVKRATTSGGPYTAVATGVTATSYTNTGLTNGTTYYYVVSAVNTAGESANSAQVSTTPQNVTSSLVAQYKVSNANATDSQIYASFNIKNTGTSAVNLSNVKLRYYFTKDTSTAGLSFWCDYAQVGTSNVSGTFVTITPAVTGADTYLEISFGSAAGSIAAGGQTGDIQIRVAKADWTNFNETGDYSFDGTITAYTDWSKATLYQSGTFVWGIEP